MRRKGRRGRARGKRKTKNERERDRMCMNEVKGAGGSGWKVMDELCMAPVSGESLGSV